VTAPAVMVSGVTTPVPSVDLVVFDLRRAAVGRVT
jgi:hypothetical protein